MINKKKLLIGLISVAVLIFLFFFIVQPQYEKFVDNKRIEGIEMYIRQIMLPSLQEKGYLEIPIGEKILILVPYFPEEK